MGTSFTIPIEGVSIGHADDHKVLAVGVQSSLLCRDDASFYTREQVQANANGLPPSIQDWMGGRLYDLDICEFWDSGTADPSENQAVHSDRPTLIFAGRYDPITPSAWGTLAAETLDNSYFYEFPADGHGVMRVNLCALDIGLQFINDPLTEPDASCLADESPPDFQ